MTDEVELKLDKKIVNKFIKKINIPVKYVFGNVEEIIKEMEDKKWLNKQFLKTLKK